MNGRVSVLREGDGAGALVLLHGFTGSSASWQEVARLVDTRLVDTRVALYALDLPGHGRALAPGPRTSFEDGVSALAAEVAALNLAGPRIVGYSLGGRIALALLARTRLFSRGVLIGATAGLERADARTTRRADDEVWAARLEAEGVEAFVRAWAATPALAPASVVPETRLEAQRAVRTSHTASGLASALRTFSLGAMPDLWPELPGIDVPVTVVVGEHDAKFRPLAARLALELPAATLEVIEGCGHNVVLERPEAMARILSDLPRAD